VWLGVAAACAAIGETAAAGAALSQAAVLDSENPCVCMGAAWRWGAGARTRPCLVQDCSHALGLEDRHLLADWARSTHACSAVVWGRVAVVGVRIALQRACFARRLTSAAEDAEVQALSMVAVTVQGFMCFT
jgi:hypothetical protein